MRTRLSLQMGAGGSSDSDIIALFAAGEKGAWYDPSDLTTMFQDSAGATPVTDYNQSVGMIKDKSGNNRHMIQATAASKPILKKDSNNNNFLEFDGTDDYMTCASFDMTAQDEISLFACAAKYAETTVGTLLELSAVMGSNNGTFAFFFPSTVSGANASFGSKGTTAVFPAKTGLAAGTTPRALMGLGDISTPNAELRVDDLSTSSIVATQGTGNYGNYTMYMGRRGGTSAPFYGSLYSMIIRGKTSTAAEIANAKAYIKSKGGL